MFTLALSVQECKKSTVEGVLILARLSFSSQKHTRTINRHISRIIKAKRVILQVKPAPTQKQVSEELKQILLGITFFREIILSITKCTREILSRTSTQQYNLRECPERRKPLRNLLKLHNVSKYTAIK